MNKTKQPDRYSAAARLVEAQRELDNLILATPTGEIRNRLTGVNILLLDALRMLDRLPTPPRRPE